MIYLSSVRNHGRRAEIYQLDRGYRVKLMDMSTAASCIQSVDVVDVDTRAEADAEAQRYVEMDE